jgi:hypothetical protein
MLKLGGTTYKSFEEVSNPPGCLFLWVICSDEHSQIVDVGHVPTGDGKSPEHSGLTSFSSAKHEFILAVQNWGSLLEILSACSKYLPGNWYFFIELGLMKWPKCRGATEYGLGSNEKLFEDHKSYLGREFPEVV